MQLPPVQSESDAGHIGIDVFITPPHWLVTYPMQSLLAEHASLQRLSRVVPEEPWPHPDATALFSNSEGAQTFPPPLQGEDDPQGSPPMTLVLWCTLYSTSEPAGCTLDVEHAFPSTQAHLLHPLQLQVTAGEAELSV